MGTSARLERFSAMAFIPDATKPDRRDLILARAEAARLRRLEDARIRAAREMVERFFGLEGRRQAP